MYICKICIFCEKGNQIIQQKKKNVREVKKWFVDLGRNVNEKTQKVLNDDLGLEEEKGKILESLWKEKKKKKREKKNKVYRTIRRVYIRQKRNRSKW